MQIALLEEMMGIVTLDPIPDPVGESVCVMVVTERETAIVTEEEDDEEDSRFPLPRRGESTTVWMDDVSLELRARWIAWALMTWMGSAVPGSLSGFLIPVIPDLEAIGSFSWSSRCEDEAATTWTCCCSSVSSSDSLLVHPSEPEDEDPVSSIRDATSDEDDELEDAVDVVERLLYIGTGTREYEAERWAVDRRFAIPRTAVVSIPPPPLPLPDGVGVE